MLEETVIRYGTIRFGASDVCPHCHKPMKFKVVSVDFSSYSIVTRCECSWERGDESYATRTLAENALMQQTQEAKPRVWPPSLEGRRS